MTVSAHPAAPAPTPAPLAGGAPAQPSPAAAPPGSPDAQNVPDAPHALDRLFRLSIRAGRVHPLRALLQRYRAGERG